MLDCSGEKMQPTRVAMKERLAEVRDAASRLQHALLHTPTRELLEIAPSGPIEYRVVFEPMLQDLAGRAERAMTSPALSTEDGKTMTVRLYWRFGSACGVVPEIAAGTCIERIDMAVLAADENAIADDCVLPENRDDAGDVERPFHVEPPQLPNPNPEATGADDIERQSKEVSLARTNNFLGIYGSLVSICLGMSGKRRERIASRMEQARVTWRSAAWHVIAHDSTSQALAWTKHRQSGWGIFEYTRQLADIATGRVEPPRAQLHCRERS